MAGSSETPSVHEVKSSLLFIKLNQNLVIDLASCKYDSYMLPIVECVKHYPLTVTLTMMENIPVSLLSKAYSSASFIKEEQKITFEIQNCKTSISKSRFFLVLGLRQSDDMINPESVTSAALLKMFYQMWYKETLIVVSKFWKPNLLPQWNDLFTLLFKDFSERVTGSDCASKLFMEIIYGIYTGLNTEYGVVLWFQVIQITYSTTRQSEVSCARFWTIIVYRAIAKL